MKKIYTYSLILLTSLAIVACTANTSNRNNKTPENLVEEIIQEDSQGLFTKSADSAKVVQLRDSILPIIDEMRQKEEEEDFDPQAALNQVINPLSGLLLNINFMINVENQTIKDGDGNFALPDLVRAFNYAILRVQKKQAKLLEPLDIFNTYHTMLNYHCAEDLSGKCTLVKYYRQTDSNQMVQIIKIIYEMQTEDSEKTRLLGMAFDIRNSEVDETLRYMFLSRVAESLKIKDDGSISEEIRQDRLRRDAYLFANILKIDLVIDQGIDVYSQVIDQLNPWALSRKIESPANPAMSELLQIAGRSLIYKKGSNQLAPNFSKIAKKKRYSVLSEGEQGNQFILDNLKGCWITNRSALGCSQQDDNPDVDFAKVYERISENPRLLQYSPAGAKIIEKMLSGITFKNDEYDFLVYQTFFGHYHPEDAEAFWKHTTKDHARLIEAATNFYKLQFVNHIIYTSTRINNFYKRHRTTGLIELLGKIDLEDQVILKKWDYIGSRSIIMKNVISRTISIAPQSIKDSFDELESIINPIDKNIKHFVTYPNMYTLLYFITKHRLDDVVQRWWGPWTINFKNIITDFFAASPSPDRPAHLWFNITVDKSVLKTNDVIFSFYYALQTQIFEIYQEGTFSNFTPDDFFRVVVRQLLYDGEESYRTTRISFETLTQKNSAHLQAAKRACIEEKDKQEKEAVALYELRQKKGSKFDWKSDFNQALMDRNEQGYNINMSQIDDVFYEYSKGSNTTDDYLGMGDIFHEDIKKSLRAMRNENFGGLKPRYNIRLAFILAEIYKSQFKDKEDEITEILDDEFKTYKDEKAKLLNSFFRWYDIFKDCPEYFYKRDKDLRHALIFQEMSYLSQIFNRTYDYLETIDKADHFEQSTLDELEKIRVELAKDYARRGAYPDSYKETTGYTSLNPTRFSQFPMDIRARLRMHFEDVFGDIFLISEDEDYPNKSYFKRTSQSNINFRWDLPRDQAEEAFINEGIAAFARSIKWARSYPPLDGFDNKGDIVTLLFKLGRVTLNSATNCDKEPVTSQKYMSDCRKVEAKEIIDHYKMVVDEMNIWNRDSVILKATSLQEKYKINRYHQFIKIPGQPKLYSYIDRAFEKVFSDSYVGGSDKFWFKSYIDDFKNYAQTRENAKYIFSDPIKDKEINKIIKDQYGSWIQDYFDFIKEFLRAVKHEIKTNPPEPMLYSYYLNEDPIPLNEDDGSPLSPMISPIMYDTNFKGSIINLKNTGAPEFDEIFDKNLKEIEDIIGS